MEEMALSHAPRWRARPGEALGSRFRELKSVAWLEMASKDTGGEKPER